MDTTAPTRRLDLDWLRIAAFGFLIAYHVGMYYVTWDWHIKSPHASEAIEPLMMMLNPWRLSLLFFIAGSALAFLLRSRGLRPGAVAWQRTVFLLVPVIFGMAVVVPPQAYYEVVEKLGYPGSYADFMKLYYTGYHGFCKDGKCLDLPTWNHLWFVVYLWAYTLVAIPVARHARGADAIRRALSGWRLVVIPWLLLAAARILLLTRFGSTHALVDDWYNHAAYGIVFAIGFLLARHEPAWDWLVAHRRVLPLIALAAYAEWLVYAVTFNEASPPPDAYRMLQRGVWALLQWTASLSALAWACHWLRCARDSAARKYLSNAVFCYYVVHQTAIIVIAWQLRPLGLHPVVEGVVLLAATAATCLASYELFRRIPGVRALFGIRPDAPKPLHFAPPGVVSRPGSAPSS